MKGVLHPLSFLIQSDKLHDLSSYHTLETIKQLDDRELSSLLGQAMKNLSALIDGTAVPTAYVKELWGRSIVALAAVYDAAWRERAKRRSIDYVMDRRLVRLLATYMQTTTTKLVEQSSIAMGLVPSRLQQWFELISMSARTGSIVSTIRPDWWLVR